jgi:hypothetical protein
VGGTYLVGIVLNIPRLSSRIKRGFEPTQIATFKVIVQLDNLDVRSCFPVNLGMRMIRWKDILCCDGICLNHCMAPMISICDRNSFGLEEHQRLCNVKVSSTTNRGAENTHSVTGGQARRISQRKPILEIVSMISVSE